METKTEDAFQPTENPLRTFTPKLPWPEGGSARLDTAKHGGIAVFTMGKREYEAQPEAFFSDAADLILYMLDKYGIETQRKVFAALLLTQSGNELADELAEGFADIFGGGGDEDDGDAGDDGFPDVDWPEADPDATSAEIPLSARMNEAINLLRENGWIVSPDLSPKANITEGRASIHPGGGGQSYGVEVKGGGGAGEYRGPIPTDSVVADNTIHVQV